MRKFLMLLAITLALSGCAHFHVYRINIQQGNFITEKMLSQLKPGQTKTQVATIMGLPVLRAPFNENEWYYVYTFQPGGGKITKKHLNLYFKNNKLYRITGDYQLTNFSHS